MLKAKPLRKWMEGQEVGISFADMATLYKRKKHVVCL